MDMPGQAERLNGAGGLDALVSVNGSLNGTDFTGNDEFSL
jgi:hypothetical protein